MRQTENKNYILEKKEHIKNAIKNELNTTDHFFIIITGDVAFSGLPEEYLYVTELIDYLIKEIKAYHKDINTEVIIIPGNHDCDFSMDNNARKIILKEVHKNPNSIDNQIILTCTNIQNNFFEFAEIYHNDRAIDKSLSDRLFTRFNFDYGKCKISFNCYNIAWLSQIDEQQSQLLFPCERYNLPKIDSSDCTISLIHHPPIWLHHINARKLIQHLEETSDFILSGHEHESTESLRDNLNGKITKYFEADALQSDNTNESYFKLIHIDKETCSQTLINYSWNADLATYQYDFENDRKEIPLQKSSTLKLNIEYQSKINNIGIKITHPNKTDLLLEDLFVFQDLMNLKKSGSNKKINSKTLCLIDPLQNKKSIIFGDEASGKTSLAYMVQKKINDQGYISVFIDGKTITTSILKNPQKIIDEYFVEQYNKHDLHKFTQHEKRDVFIIIDDFDKSKINSEYKIEFIQSIKRLYKNFIIFSNDSLEIEVLSNSKMNLAFEEFELLKIVECGCVISDKLIEQWITLGKHGLLNRKDINDKKHEIMQLIDTTIGKNFIPRFPIYLLTILQAIEAGAASELQGSAYCHYYHYLIVQALGNSNIKPNEFELYFSYLSNLAFELFKKEQHDISFEELTEFNISFCKIKEISIDTHRILGTLIKSKIICNENNIYYFSQNYLYYYFVSKYFSEKIDTDEVKNIIKSISKRLYRTEFANIIIFLIHHSKKPFISDQVLREAKSLFSKISATTFSKEEIQTFNKLIEKDVRFLIEEKSQDDARKEILEAKDDNAKLQKNKKDESCSITEEIKDLDIFSKINLSFKLIEILGQICKNYWASIDGPIKYSLLEEACLLGLRSLKILLKDMEDYSEILFLQIKERIEEKKLVGREHIDSITKKIIFDFATLLSFSFVTKISKGIASKDLNISITKIYEQNKTEATKLIKIASQLQFKDGLDSNELIKFNDSLHDNLLLRSILRMLVIKHLYIFDVGFKLKQRICEKLNIGVKKQKEISIEHKR